MTSQPLDGRSTDRDVPLSGDADAVAERFGFHADDDGWVERLSRALYVQVPGRLGPFENLEPIGRGGQGLVYRAFDTRTRRWVALKRIAAGLFATPEMQARFDREIEASAAMSHPNIVTIFGRERIDDQLILSMQHVDGVPFDQWAAPFGGPRRSITDCLRAFVQVCDAVQHAHQRGVIHRDLKPSNILVDAEQRPHVLDFGLAKLRSDAQERWQHTRTGEFLGTPAYASPEQARGDWRAVDARTDIYALGAILYRALAGRALVDPALSISAALRHVVEMEPARASAANPAIGRELDMIIAKALSKERKDRYTTVDALADDIRRFLRGEAVLAHPPGRVYLLRKFLRRHWIAASLVAGFILLTTSAAVATTALYFRAEASRIDTEKAMLTARREAANARGAATFVQQLFVIARRGGAAGAQLTVRELVDRAAEGLRNPNEHIQPAELASLRKTIADTYRDLGLNEPAVPLYEAAVAYWRSAGESETYQLGQCLDALGRGYRAVGRWVDAEAAIEEAWQVYARNPWNSTTGDLAVTANSLGLIKKSLGKYDEARGWFLESLRYYVAGWGQESDLLPAVLNNLGAVEILAGRPAAAEAHYRESLALVHRLHGDTAHLDRALARAGLAEALDLLGDPYSDAEQLFIESIDDLSTLVGAANPRAAGVRRRFARVLQRQGRIEEALWALETARESFIAAQQWSDVLVTGAIELELLLTHGADGAVERTMPFAHIEQAVKKISAGDARAREALITLGELLTRWGQREAACRMLQKADGARASGEAPDERKTAAVQERLTAPRE